MSNLLSDGTVNEVLSLRQELSNMRKKLQDYADTIVSLHGELRTLRHGICNSCKRKFVPGMLESSEDAKTRAVDFSSFENQHPPPGANPAGHSPGKIHAPDCTPSSSGPPTSISPSSQTPLVQPFPVSPSSTRIPPPLPQVVAVQKRPTPIVSHHVPSNETIPKIEPSIPWFVKRHAATVAPLGVTFVRALSNNPSVRSVRFSPDSKYLAAGLGDTKGVSTHGAVVIYDVETGERTCVLAENPSKYFLKGRPQILGLSFSPHGRYLAAGDSSAQVTVWDIPNKRVRSVFRGHLPSVDSVNFSPNGRFVVSLSFHDDTLVLWNVRDGLSKVLSNANDIWSVRFSPNGNYIAGGNRSGMVMIWAVPTGRLVKRWNCGNGLITRVAFTLDGMGLLSGHADGSVTSWNIGSLGVVQSSGATVVTRTLEYEGLKEWIYGIAVSPCGRWVASVSGDESVIWDTHDAMQQCTLIGHGGRVVSVDFSHSGKYLALGSWDGRVSIWKYASP